MPKPADRVLAPDGISANNLVERVRETFNLYLNGGRTRLLRRVIHRIVSNPDCPNIIICNTFEQIAKWPLRLKEDEVEAQRYKRYNCGLAVLRRAMERQRHARKSLEELFVSLEGAAPK